MISQKAETVSVWLLDSKVLHHVPATCIWWSLMIWLTLYLGFFLPILQEGQEIIEDFVRQVQELPKDLSQEDLVAAVNKLKAEVEKKDNAYVKDILAKSNLWIPLCW